MSKDKRQPTGRLFGRAKSVPLPPQLEQVESDLRGLMKKCGDLGKELDSRKRAEEEEKEKLLLEFIPVADALEAFARDVVGSGTLPNQYVNELEMISRRFARAFERSGVTRLLVKPRETPLDATYHEVVRTESKDGLVGGTILEVVKPGYSLSGRVLRPAKVIVAAED